MSILIRWNLTVLTPTLAGDRKRLAPIDSCLTRATPKTWPHPLHRNAFVVEVPQ